MRVSPPHHIKGVVGQKSRTINAPLVPYCVTPHFKCHRNTKQIVMVRGGDSYETPCIYLSYGRKIQRGRRGSVAWLQYII